MRAELSQRPEPRLCIIGTGALGSALLDRLRAHRFASVLLVDPDPVAERNLPLSSLLRRATAHPAYVRSSPAPHNKAKLLAAAAQDLDNLPWRSEPQEIADVGWQDLREADVLCCCTDNLLSRVETAWTARALGKPMLDGAVLGQGHAAGRVTVYPATCPAACALCGLSEDRRAAVLGYAASASLGCQAPEEVPRMMAALATLDAVADAMLAEISRWERLAGEVSCTARFSQLPDSRWQADTVQLTRSVTCPWHDGFPGTLEALAWEEPVTASLANGTRELVLNWPVCTEATCDACGLRSRPMQRVARVRRFPCPACGHSRQQPLRVIHRIGHGDAYSAFSPRQLGMPERHLYWLR